MQLYCIAADTLNTLYKAVQYTLLNLDIYLLAAMRTS